jgi:prepilin-type N-terminal cleavage/methylation domain-containing protein
MRHARAEAGFTLVEMLVSIAVLVLLMVLIAQLFDSATATATMSRTHINSDEAARLVLDRVGSDLAGMARRPDVNYIFYKNGAAAAGSSSDAMFFYSEAPGYLDPDAVTTSGSASTTALVGYRINENNQYYPGTPVLERLGETLTWGGAPDTTGTNPGGMVFLPYTLAGNWTYTLGTPPYAPLDAANSQNSHYDTAHYQVLSDMVFRMELCFLVKSGTYAVSGTSAVTGTTGYSNAPTAISTKIPQPYVTDHYFTGATAPDLAGNVYGFPPDLVGVVVTIAVLDNTSRGTIANGGVAKLAAALNDSLPASAPTGLNTTPGDTTVGDVQADPEPTSQIWQSQLEQSGFAQFVGIPALAAQQVRVYERTFYLDEN